MPALDLGADLALLSDAARAAGDIARPFFEGDVTVWDKSGGQGPVTEADLAIDAMLTAQLLGARPQYGWLSEETEDDSARLQADTVFIIDPIDGTRAFVEGHSNWSHSLAIAHQGQVVAAAVYVPMRDLLYAATLGGGATLNGVPMTTTVADETGARVLAAKPNFAEGFWPGGVPPLERHYRSSLAYRLSLVAAGDFDAMLTLRPTWEWDVAAGTLLVSEAGGLATQMDGAAPRFNTPEHCLNGIVAAGPALHGQLLSRLTAQP